MNRLDRQYHGTAHQIARGVAAGFFVCALPLPMMQVPLAIFVAWLMRGSKLIAILPTFISNTITMAPLAYLQFRLGLWLTPERGATANAMNDLLAALSTWSITNFSKSTSTVLAAIGRLSSDVLIPLSVGVLVSGLVAAILSYPITLLLVRLAHRFSPVRPRQGKLGAIATLNFEPPADEQIPSGQEAMERYAFDCRGFSRARRVQLLIDGAGAFGPMLAAIESATASVDMETYILRDDVTGRKFRDALACAARRGVRVRLVYDYIGSISLDDGFVAPLLGAGVRVGVYNPPLIFRHSTSVNRRDHRKILIIDSRLTFTGGLNISDDYVTVEGQAGWRDTHMLIEDERIAASATLLFEYAATRSAPYDSSASRISRVRGAIRRRLARLAGGKTGECDELTSPTSPETGAAVKLLGNKAFHHRRLIRRAYLHAIGAAKRYILIANAYFIPDRGVRKALIRAAKRGVNVCVIVAAHSDVPVASWASRNLYGELLSAGIRIFEWAGGMMHAKTAVIDDEWAIVGSYNFDHRSLLHQLEVAAIVIDRDFAVELRRQSAQDIESCYEVTLAEHESRPWRQMMIESAAYTIRHWL